MIELSRRLAVEWGPRVRVSCIAPDAANYVTGEALYVAGGQQICGGNQALFDEDLE